MFFHSDIVPLYYILPVIGFVIGLFATILGGGGGFFFLPVLTLFMDVPASIAVTTSLVATVPVCIAGLVGHLKQGNIAFSIAPAFLITGLIGAFAGSSIAGKISDETLKNAFGIYAILIACNIFHTTWKRRVKEMRFVQKRKETIAKGSFLGLMAGLITGVFGSSGTAPVLAGLFSMNIPLNMVVGTSLLVVLANTLFAVGAHSLVGQTDLTLVYFLTFGSALGAAIGPIIFLKVNVGKSENNVRYGYGTVMAIIGVLMIIR